MAGHSHDNKQVRRCAFPDSTRSAHDEAALRLRSILDQLERDFPPAPEQDHRPICAIDLEPIDPQRAEALPCGHVFHAECIKLWLDKKNTCPIDRSPADEWQAVPGVSSDAGASDPLVATANATASSSSGRESSSSTEMSERQISSSSTASANTPATSHSLAGRIDPSQVEQLAFHYRLVSELEALRHRADERVAEGSEVGLNTRWTTFLQCTLRALNRSAEDLQNEILGREEQ